MNITEVRVYRRNDPDKKLRAFATITFDNCFVVRDVKVIEGSKGFFVAMPSRRLREPCVKCGHRGDAGSHFCSQCGSPMMVPYDEGTEHEEGSRRGDHKDIAHPITPEFREYIQKKVLEAYKSDNDSHRETVS
ncbi:MAG: septation protein SpoVG family protein [Candidatus Omnitrophica bacterium]|nr:septation protein SpoVG family protein [Candidatus Omnitrophota bacterium]